MITSTLIMPLIATSTLATVIFIGLGFLPRPSRATALWSASFASAMCGSYVWLAQDMLASMQFRALGSSLVIAPMALIWSGLRAYRGRTHQFIPLSITYMIVIPVGLVLSSFSDAYGIAFRIVFTLTAVFAALTIFELVRLGSGQRDESLPLLAACGAFIAFAVITVVDGFLVAGHVTRNIDSLQFLRTVNLIGSNVVIICCLVTLLLLTIRSPHSEKAAHGAFERTARDRLSRAEASLDQWWSVLDIRLDDPEDIRAASSTAAFNAVSERFAHDVELVLPADADIERMSTTRVIALVPRAQSGVRELLMKLLERISTVEDHQAVPIRLTASIGWAQVAAVGYDLDNLAGAASTAVEVAQQHGGDRWERVHGASQ
ncbi:hypothetical protein [Microbacterium sp.]|uniref:hypothetical protein n=1 Tax=Microbacterium sp. TaxID=51671 RepID=UPI003F9C03D0